MGRSRTSFNPGGRARLTELKPHRNGGGRKMGGMTIHQIQLRYDPAADRLLMQVRTTKAELYSAWLTRRMVARLYPLFLQKVALAGVARSVPQAMPVPEARQMLEQAALQRPLPGTDFQKPFSEADASHPLGPEPLLPAAIDLRPVASGGLVITLREERGRRLEMSLTNELSTALLRLMDGALKMADWALPAHAAPAADEVASTLEGRPEPGPGRLLS
jgi:hypothetical protein